MGERVSVIIPALDEVENLARVLPALSRSVPHGTDVEMLVVDGGSQDDTPQLARRLGATVIEVGGEVAVGNPALLRNVGARAAGGDVLVFLDADCEPTPGWLRAILAAHERGWRAVGGSFDRPPGLSPSARCDYYAGWYHFHSRRPAGPTVSTPPGNFSIDAELFHDTDGFDETPGIAYSHEELRLQGELRRAGIPIHFEPDAVVLHHNRPGLGNLLERHYRWGFGAVPSKAASGAARFAWVYRRPWLTVAAALPLAPPTAAYVVWTWLRAGVVEPLVWAPAILAGRVAYGLGMMRGALRWMAEQPLEGEAS
jgi:glycosyltransferase involved in cell wall biosynthesis